ncbi:hypothetical protein BAG01nite_12800 [Brevibacillus agri]|uniref:Copper amine oxidase N-terminal domain-containing protein n=1 Tax=Brevibacillus agri TaxID=51101 RepID=A0A3M8AU03_9BACL|nr:copper amine oxidase N-terminal domain-containing protein [Brevibacillus agri]QAV13243.1 hypothetical protein BA6348_11060 [Brevibacillus agri]RNB54117.1 copper amine oxidase N-terminal domain-containing protein [Brevibacillus agri]GED25178.1 hypothetical protein BAG01nite_12800 [Brevibacillus agri]
MRHSRLIKCFFVLTLLLSVLGFEKVGSAEDYPPVTVKINDKAIQGQNGIVDGGTIFIPAKAVFENLDIKVEWDQSTSTLKGYQFDTIRIEISPNKDLGKLDGKPFLMDFPPKVVNGTLMVPSSLITQLFNYEVKFEPIANIVKIDKTQLIAVDPYASYNKMKKELEQKYNLTNNGNNVVNNQESEKLKQFKNAIKDYMGRTIWTRTTLMKDADGKYVDVEKFAPMWILEIKEDTFFTLKLKSGDMIYYLTAYDEYSVHFGFLLSNPYTTYKWSNKVWDHIKKNSVFVGMNEDMVWLSWGLPTRKNVSKYAWGTEEQWVYDLKSQGTKYLYFKNGILTSIQTSE